MIIFEELVYQEALRRKMTVPAAEMRRAESDFRKQFATPEEFNACCRASFTARSSCCRRRSGARC